MVKILWIAECIFKQFLGDAPSKISLVSKTLQMKYPIMRGLLKNGIFSSLHCHDFRLTIPSKTYTFYTDIESDCQQILDIRLLHYRQTFTEDKILNSNIGKR